MKEVWLMKSLHEASFLCWAEELSFFCMILQRDLCVPSGCVIHLSSFSLHVSFTAECWNLSSGRPGLTKSPWAGGCMSRSCSQVFPTALQPRRARTDSLLWWFFSLYQVSHCQMHWVMNSSQVSLGHMVQGHVPQRRFVHAWIPNSLFERGDRKSYTIMMFDIAPHDSQFVYSCATFDNVPRLPAPLEHHQM